MLPDIEKILEQNNITDENSIYFIKVRHLGDIVRTLPAISLFRQYHRDKRDRRLIVLTTESKAGLIRMNPDVDEVRVLPEQELWILDSYSSFGNKSGWIYADADLTEEILSIYEIPDDFAAQHATLMEIRNEFTEDAILAAKTYMEEQKLDPAKTLLLVPDSLGSKVSSLDLQKLKPVVNVYQKAGFRILVNSFGTEHEFPGTEPTDLHADVILAVIRQGVTVIGVQCGLLDVCEWMGLTQRMIKVYLLRTNEDWKFYIVRGGNATERIEKKEYGYTIAALYADPYENLCEDIIRLSEESLL